MNLDQFNFKRRVADVLETPEKPYQKKVREGECIGLDVHPLLKSKHYSVKNINVNEFVYIFHKLEASATQRRVKAPAVKPVKRTMAMYQPRRNNMSMRMRMRRWLRSK